jgi:hypothetical protein
MGPAYDGRRRAERSRIDRAGEGSGMDGSIGTIHAAPGARDALAAIPIGGFGERRETRPVDGHGPVAVP